MRYYIVTENEKNNSFYGVLETIDNELFQTLSGKINGNDKEGAQNVTKMLLQKIEKNDILKIRKNIYFKYEDLQTAKIMEYNFRNDKFYIDYSSKNGVNLFSSPAVFLSDLANVNKAKQVLNRYKSVEQYYNNQGRGK